MWTWNEWMITGKIKELASNLQDFYLLSIRGLVSIIKKPFYFKDTIEQMDYAGAGSLLIILLVSLFIGMALSLQLSAELSALGLKMYTGMIVGISVIREIGPVTAALVFAGRVGAGMASELGSMILGHQVDTLRVFGDFVQPFIFGYLIACISCYMGLSTKGGSIGLRRSTTRAVVASMIVIIVSDFLLTRILLYVLGFSV